VQVKAAARKDDSGTRTLATSLGSSTTTALGATTGLSPAYQYISDIFVNDPNTSSPWTVSGVNNSVFGYKVIS